MKSSASERGRRTPGHEWEVVRSPPREQERQRRWKKVWERVKSPWRLPGLSAPCPGGLRRTQAEEWEMLRSPHGRGAQTGSTHGSRVIRSLLRETPRLVTGPPPPEPQHRQDPPQTDVPDTQKPPQAPEETKQQEEALGEGPLAAGRELPSPGTNTSLEPQTENLGTEDQPRAEVEPDPEVSEAEEASPLENGAAEEGAPENVRVKQEEEAEALGEGSAPSSSSSSSSSSSVPELQKCPRGEQGKAKSRRRPSRGESSSLLGGGCRRGYVREWSHPCTECGKRFRLKINLIIHQRSHAKEGPYECSLCEISFADKRHLDLHQGIHVKDRALGAKVWGNVHPELRVRPRRNPCGTSCPQNPGGARGAWLGLAKEEPRDRGSPAGGCVSRQQSLRSPWRCTQCKKSFSCSHSLQRHLRSHARGRPHVCGTCKKCFTRGTHLRRHQKIHERQKALGVPPGPPAPPSPAQPQDPPGAQVPRSPAQASERNVSPAAATTANAVLEGPPQLGEALEKPWAGRDIQPVVRLGTRAVLSRMVEK
ncbi:zinc finger protein 467 isoform X1 [Heliangelus exortis]|uniref:zinc finger protein 467 isoform X1 n=1 Tax=Heliangelus exortis TaxID=472823 RepID=UPI003A8E4B70